MKLLSPAGNFESLKSAVFNGAEEVYIGVNEFNARNNVDGFTVENLKDAVSFAHLFNVKVNLAVNILFKDEELQSAVDLAIKAYNAGVDAFIVQDLGLAKILFDNYPEIELHASTQMGIHNLEGVRAILPYGFKRVVLSRETPLAEIKRIKESVNIEIEYFVQGALCVCFSGNCYLSSALFDASGNRGRCKQLCRLPYVLENNGKMVKKGYLLSAKDINMSQRLKDLEDSGVDVLKIEGRARRTEYVATVTAEYRKALDGKEFSRDNIALAFNREYTAGYFDGNSKIISDYNNHIGLKIGKIENVEFGKKFNRVYISSNRELTPKSTFKTFSNLKETAVVTAYDLKKDGHSKYQFTTTQNLKIGDTVRLIIDAGLENEYLQKTVKRKVEIDLYLQIGKPIRAEFVVNGEKISVLGGVCQSALNSPLDQDRIRENFKKSPIFDGELSFVVFEKVFLPVKELNEFRREVFDRLESCLISVHQKNLDLISVNLQGKSFGLLTGESHAIYSPEKYDIKDILEFKNSCEKLGKKPYLDTPNFALKEDIKILKEIIEKTGVGIVAQNYYALNLCDDYLIGAGLNVYNSVTANALGKPVLQSEKEMANFDYPFMTFRHCPIKEHLGGNCANCKYIGGITYSLENGKRFKLKRKKLSTCTFYLTK